MATKKEKPEAVKAENPVKKAGNKKTKSTRKPYKKTLSPRARVVVQKMSEKGGNGKAKTKGQILKEAGYSPTVQKTPQKVFSTKAIQQALHNAGITDDFLVKKHMEHLEARKFDYRDYYDWDHEEYDENPKDIEEEIQADLEDRLPGAKLINVAKLSKGKDLDIEYLRVKFTAPDYSVQDKSLEKAYKIKGAYAPEKHDIGNFSLLDLFTKK